MNPTISYPDFEKVDIRVGKIIDVQDFPEARKPAFKLKIDFGSEIGIKSSSSQITDLYTKEEVMGKYVAAVVNFPPKQVGKFVSEVLTLGVYNEEGKVVLMTVDKSSQLGARVL